MRTGMIVQQKNSNFWLVNSSQSAPAPQIANDNFLAEADDFEAIAGPNPYSNFLRKHARRPDRAQAAAIGRLMGGRVRASDGTLQPILTKGERAALSDIKRRRREWAQRFDHIQRTAAAVAALTLNRDDPSTVFEYGAERFLTPEFRETLESAVLWLNAFAQQVIRHEKDSCAKNPLLVIKDCRCHARQRPDNRANRRRSEKTISEGDKGGKQRPD